ncbi:membrane protein insertion efficiency factor YidD [Candidatus Comchoanobacter bicostacola]|uniref:Membrane protein insertion efficiency factor YidD n=1 Tax=Candidatus Comchoanobacter bicostacola TaxID=2919598 RepID=A0ABY5DJ00_9GAMM|nr:membrane protein insertion efficiency factor YidD [Candidatus Comchoanobacter bicostacola]
MLRVIHWYQRNFAFLQHRCVFTPSCSNYAKEAFLKHSYGRALWISIVRLLRCGPWIENHYDPVPQKESENVK